MSETNTVEQTDKVLQLRHALWTAFRSVYERNPELSEREITEAFSAELDLARIELRVDTFSPGA